MLIMNSAAYAGTALAFRDRLVVEWNRTQQNQTLADPKRVYCESIEIFRAECERADNSLDLSLEFLMGRALDNAMLNVEMKDVAKRKFSTTVGKSAVS